ncbi:hypothetical protein SZ55_2715 [Pseudomonas sp. FeS53a]|nr:hypothetical protein SZ55_2715 [Pseudomonas sp. FeS53a]
MAWYCSGYRGCEENFACFCEPLVAKCMEPASSGYPSLGECASWPGAGVRRRVWRRDLENAL